MIFGIDVFTFIMSDNFWTVSFVLLKFSSDVIIIIPKAAKSLGERSSGTYMMKVMNENSTS